MFWVGRRKPTHRRGNPQKQEPKAGIGFEDQPERIQGAGVESQTELSVWTKMQDSDGQLSSTDYYKPEETEFRATRREPHIEQEGKVAIVNQRGPQGRAQTHRG